MFDIEKFIACVHDNPALWDTSLEEYSIRNERVRCWCNIGEVMYTDWLQVDSNEKDNRVRDLKNKWRHIRDNFIRHVNLCKNGTTASAKKKPYVYAESLMFLMKSVDKEQTQDSASEEGNNQEDITNNILIGQEDTMTSPPKLSSQWPRRKRRKLSHFQSQPSTLHLSRNSKEEDPDRLFILSVLSDYKKLNYDEKLDFKLMVIEYFRNLRLQKTQIESA